MAYDEGALVRVSGICRSTAGVDVDPTTVKLSYKDPTGADTTLTYLVDAALVRDSAGHYHADISTTGVVHGRWYYRWWSTGTGQGATETSFDVRSSKFI